MYHSELNTFISKIQQVDTPTLKEVIDYHKKAMYNAQAVEHVFEGAKDDYKKHWMKWDLATFQLEHRKQMKRMKGSNNNE